MICRYYNISESNKDTVIKGVLENKTLLLKKASEYEKDETEFKNFKVYINLSDKKGLKKNFNLNQLYIDDSNKISFEEYFKQLSFKKEKELKDVLYKIVNECIGTVCFSTRIDNDYLWNNYAGKDGFCVVYNDELRNIFKSVFKEANLPNLFKKVKYSDKELIYNFSSLKHIANFALEIPFRKKTFNSNTNENYCREEELHLAVLTKNLETGERLFEDDDGKDKIKLVEVIGSHPIKYVITNKDGKYSNEIEACCKKENIKLKWN